MLLKITNIKAMYVRMAIFFMVAVLITTNITPLVGIAMYENVIKSHNQTTTDINNSNTLQKLESISPITNEPISIAAASAGATIQTVADNNTADVNQNISIIPGAEQATDKSNVVTTTEVAAAINHTDGLLTQSDNNQITSDDESIVKTSTTTETVLDTNTVAPTTTTVEIPKDANDGITIGSGDGSSNISISLPNASQSDEAQVIGDGIVAYTGNDGSANAIQATEDGGVRMLTIIDSPSAPTEYDYNVTVPDGGYIVINADGSASILNSDDRLIAAAAAPWAKDANNKVIETYFTTNGNTLTQHILHNVEDVVYPITADPFWFFIAPGSIASILQVAFWSCSAGYLSGYIWQIIWGDNKAWQAVFTSGSKGCIEGVVARFIPLGWLKNLLRIK